MYMIARGKWKEKHEHWNKQAYETIHREASNFRKDRKIMRWFDTHHKIQSRAKIEIYDVIV